MLMLKLYSLDDDSKPVCTLPIGVYTVGRGSLLKCYDQKVSRKHAVIQIEEDSVTITSIHANPLYYISVGGKNITVLTKDIPKVVNDGDKFALLPSQFWFKVRVIPYELKEETEKQETFKQSNDADVPGVNSIITSPSKISSIATISSTDLENNVTSQTTNNHIRINESLNANNEKTIYVSNNNVPTCSKYLKNLESPASSQKPESTATKDDVLKNGNVSRDGEEVAENKTTENRGKTKRDLGDANCSDSPRKKVKLVEEANETSIFNEDSHDKSKETDDEEAELQLRLNVSDSDEDKVSPNNDMELEQSLLDLDEDQLVNQDNKSVNTASHKPSEDMLGEEMHDKAEEHVSLVEEKVGSNNEIKGEDQSALDAEKNETDVNKVATSTEINIPNTADEANVNEATSSTETNKPSASDEAGPSKKKLRKERCWYGSSCYRKNPSHKTEFSHPGDDDYDSDPDDDRPTCSFGATCYRKNLEHRRQYKHPRPPAQRPNNGGLGRQRAAARGVNYANDTPDDYDYEDPFIDDGSSDEYQGDSDSAFSETDAEFTPSQGDSEDIQRLLKEAKKFSEQK